MNYLRTTQPTLRLLATELEGAPSLGPAAERLIPALSSMGIMEDYLRGLAERRNVPLLFVKKIQDDGRRCQDNSYP
jgi:hypothetical protein